MAEKEYIVSLKRGVDYAAFDDEMQAGIGRGLVTDRLVDVANSRPLSQRNTHYMLSPEEVTELLADNRVLDIEEPPENRDDITIEPAASRPGTWRKTSSIVSADLNWGMLRSTSKEDVWGSGVTSSTRPFNYNLTGKGVDVVISDTGVDTGHIEFTDADGASRIKNIDWYTASGVSGTQNANHNRDHHGHGTHCAGTAAGRTMGWAKDAHIYSLKVRGLEGTGDDNTGIVTSDCFDVIKGWHNNKPIDPATGFKRPTIVNMSWGYSINTTVTPTAGTFRGTSWTYGNAGFATDANLRDNAGILEKIFSGGNRKINLRISSVDTDIQEMLDAGIHVCIAAGNAYYYIANEGDQDWDNSVTVSGVTRNYHRGSSPYDTDAFIVGSLDVSYTGGKEQKSEFSQCGPGIGIYAAGNNIISASSDDYGGTNEIVQGGTTRVTHPLNASQHLMKISGTSMASPNLCGMLATVLEVNPNMSVPGLREWTIANAAKDKMYQGTVGDWNDYDSINCGGNTNYESKAIVASTEYNPLAKEMDVRGLKLLAWGAKGGATAVSDWFIQKVARHVEMMLDPTGTDVDATAQAAAIAGMKASNTVQFIGHTAGSYSPSILTDDANDYYPGLDIIRNMYGNVDFVWESDDSLGSYSADGQIMEVMEHVLHTLTVYALPAAYPTQFAQDNQTSDLYNACAQAISNNVFDASGYGAWPGSDPDIRALIMREYYYLLTISMWDYFSFVDGGSLSPEWNDNSRTPSGVQSNNPLGYALYNDYGKKVLTKPIETVLDSMHATSGSSGWVPNANTNLIMHTPFASAESFTTTSNVGLST
jgi:hypothetical protein